MLFNVLIKNEPKKKVTRNKGLSLKNMPNDFTLIDIETTGLDPEIDEIIEIAALKIRNNKIINTYSTLIKPKYKIDTYIEKLTGITNEMLENAPTIDLKIKEYIDFIGEDIIIGHNVNFDINFLYDEYKHYYKKDLNNNYVDTMRLARLLIPELDHHRLYDLICYFNIDSKGQHRSLIDCENTFTVYIKLKEILKEKYINEEDFINKTSKYYLRKPYELKASTITTNNIDFNVDHPLYKKKCVFTGALQNMIRKEAMQKVVDLGGIVQDNVNKETDFLIVGQLDYIKNKELKTNKIKKVEEMKLKGLNVEIIPESVFYEYLNYLE